MRSFITASLILAAAILFVACDSFAVLAKTDELLAICSEIGSGISDAPDRLFASWQDSRGLLACSTHNSQLERAENAVYTICETSEDMETRNSQLAILVSVLSRIADAHRFSLDSIL